MIIEDYDSSITDLSRSIVTVKQALDIESIGSYQDSTILRDNPGKVSLVVRYLPLHTGSGEVVKILEAARLQGKFWEALEAAYASQGRWAINHQAYPELFWNSISGVGLDPEQVSRDMQRPVVAQNIRQDTEDARALGVDKTPGFFVNGRPLVEFGQAQLLRLVNEALQREYGG